MGKITLTIKRVAKSPRLMDVSQVMYSLGFTDGGQEWFNVCSPDVKQLTGLKETILKEGNKVEFELDEKGQVFNLKVLETAPEEKQGHDSWQDDMVNFEDLLSAAHEKATADKKILSIKTMQLGEIDYGNKRATFKARVIISKEGSETEQIFEGTGDAEGILSGTIQPHFIRMAETRAIARALRWYTNNAKVADVEVGKETKPKK